MYVFNVRVHSAIAMADENEYNELPSSELYDEMKLHLFSRMS